MTANPILLQKKYSRVIECFARQQEISLDAALDFFYHSQVYQLIRDGAVLVQNAAEVLQELNLSSGAQAELFSEPKQGNTPNLLTHIDYTATSTDAISVRADMGIAQLLPQLLDLELQGFLQQVPGGYRRLK